MFDPNHPLLARIPDPEIPAAAYLPYRLRDGLLIVSGQLPLIEGRPTCIGAVSDAAREKEAAAAAELCALNILGWVRHACDGDLSRVRSCLRVGGFVVTGPEYYNAPAIINAASKVMTDLFGETGAHARVAIGVASLPFNASVEVEAMFDVDTGGEA